MKTIYQLEAGVVEHIPEGKFSHIHRVCRKGGGRTCPTCPVTLLAERLGYKNPGYLVESLREILGDDNLKGGTCYPLMVWNNKVYEEVVNNKKLEAILK
jgi:hypothetical protein